MKPVLAMLVLLSTVTQARASLVLVYLGAGEVYVATDSTPQVNQCAIPQTATGLRMVSLGIGPAYDLVLHTEQDETALAMAGRGPAEAALLHGTAAAKQLQPVWQTKRANILAGLERSGFQGESPALHQFCFFGLNKSKHLEVSCGAVVPQSEKELTVEMQPSRVVSYDGGAELVAFGLTEGMPQPQSVAALIQKQGAAKALKRLVTNQAHRQPNQSPMPTPVTVAHFSSLGDYQWESGAACGQDKSFGSLRAPTPAAATTVAAN